MRTLDARSDVASLGAVMYELLTGRQPYPGATQIDVALAVINKDPAPLRRVEASVPPPLEAVCLKAMAKRKEDRYESARALAEDLQRFLEGEPVLAQPPGVVVSTVRRLSKNKATSAIVAAAALGFLLAAGALIAVLRDSGVKSSRLEGRTLEDAGRLEEALGVYERLPDDRADADRVRAALQARTSEERRRHDHAQAREILSGATPEAPPERRRDIASEALARAPDFEPAYVVRAQAEQELGDDPAAYEDLGRAAKVSASPLPHFEKRAELADHLGRVEDEIDDLTAALHLSPLSADLRLTRARAYARLARMLAGSRTPETRGRAERALARAEADLALVKKHRLLDETKEAVKEARAAFEHGS